MGEGSWEVGKLGSWEDLCVRVSVRVSLEVSGGEGDRGGETGGSITATIAGDDFRGEQRLTLFVYPKERVSTKYNHTLGR